MSNLVENHVVKKDEESFLGSIEQNSPIQEETVKPKRKNKTQRKHERYLRQVEKYRLKKKQKREAAKEKRQNEQVQNENERNFEEAKSEQTQPEVENNERTKRLKVIQKERLLEVYKTENYEKNLKICIDCSFIEHMTSKEQSRLAQQIGRCYAINKALDRPTHLTLCNLDRESKFYAELCRKNEGFDRYIINVSAKSVEENYAQCSSGQISYLSPDANSYLEELDLNSVCI